MVEGLSKQLRLTQKQMAPSANTLHWWAGGVAGWRRWGAGGRLVRRTQACRLLSAAAQGGAPGSIPCVACVAHRPCVPSVCYAAIAPTPLPPAQVRQHQQQHRVVQLWVRGERAGREAGRHCVAGGRTRAAHPLARFDVGCGLRGPCAQPNCTQPADPPAAPALGSASPPLHPVDPTPLPTPSPARHPVQIGFGSGFKCNSVVWRALRPVKTMHKVGAGRAGGQSGRGGRGCRAAGQAWR